MIIVPGHSNISGNKTVASLQATLIGYHGWSDPERLNQTISAEIETLKHILRTSPVVARMRLRMLGWIRFCDLAELFMCGMMKPLEFASKWGVFDLNYLRTHTKVSIFMLTIWIRPWSMGGFSRPSL